MTKTMPSIQTMVKKQQEMSEGSSPDAIARLQLCEVSQADLQPLMHQMNGKWSEVWRDFATSHFLTLISHPATQQMEREALASLAAHLTFGISHDLGGSQPYIPVGEKRSNEITKERVLALLHRGMSYIDVGKTVGLTASRIRNIQRAERYKKFGGSPKPRKPKANAST